MAKKPLKTVKGQWHARTKSIAIMKIFAAGLLFFSCSLYFFQHLTMFADDLKAFSPFVFIFFIGIITICVYGANIAGHIEEKNLYLADRYDWLYKLVVTILVVSMLVRRFLFTNLSVPVAITVLCIVSCILVLVTPKIVDNNNDEF